MIEATTDCSSSTSVLTSRIVSSPCQATNGNKTSAELNISAFSKNYEERMGHGVFLFHWMKRIIEETNIFLPQTMQETLKNVLLSSWTNYYDVPVPTHSVSPSFPMVVVDTCPSLPFPVQSERLTRVVYMWKPLWERMTSMPSLRHSSSQTLSDGYCLSLNIHRVKPLLADFFACMRQICYNSEYTIVESEHAPPSYNLDKTKLLTAHIVYALKVHKEAVQPCPNRCRSCRDRSSGISIFESVSLLMHLILTSTDIAIYLPPCACVTVEDIAAFFGGLLLHQAGFPITFEHGLSFFSRSDLITCCMTDIDAFALLLVDKLIGEWLHDHIQILQQYEQQIDYTRTCIHNTLPDRY